MVGGVGRYVAEVGRLGRGLLLLALHIPPCPVVLTEKVRNGNCERGSEVKPSRKSRVEAVEGELHYISA